MQRADISLDVNFLPDTADDQMPLLLPVQANQVELGQPPSWDRLPRDILLYMIAWLPTKDIVALLGTNRKIRRNILNGLNAGQRANLHAFFSSQQAYIAYIVIDKQIRSSKSKKLYRAEIVAILAITLLASSLPMDNFQVRFLVRIKSAMDEIIAQGSYNLDCYDYHGAVVHKRLPEYCYNFACQLPYHVTDAGAGYWFANFIPAAVGYVSYRMALGYSFSDNPIKKIITGSIAAAAGAVTTLIPFFTNLGWPEGNAENYACCQAIDYANSFLARDGCCCTFSSSASMCGYDAGSTCAMKCVIGSICASVKFTADFIGDLSVIQPVIAVLSEVSPYIIAGIGVGALVTFGFWANRKQNQLAEIEVDPLNDYRPKQ